MYQAEHVCSNTSQQIFHSGDGVYVTAAFRRAGHSASRCVVLFRCLCVVHVSPEKNNEQIPPPLTIFGKFCFGKTGSWWVSTMAAVYAADSVIFDVLVDV